MSGVDPDLIVLAQVLARFGYRVEQRVVCIRCGKDFLFAPEELGMGRAREILRHECNGSEAELVE